MRTPIEIITEMLVTLRERVHVDDPSVGDLNYAIKMLSSNRLYEADVDLELENESESSASDAEKDGDKQSKVKTTNKDVVAWHRQFAASDSKNARN